jgi:hypothetical protein
MRDFYKAKRGTYEGALAWQSAARRAEQLYHEAANHAGECHEAAN